MRTSHCNTCINIYHDLYKNRQRDTKKLTKGFSSSSLSMVVLWAFSSCLCVPGRNTSFFGNKLFLVVTLLGLVDTNFGGESCSTLILMAPTGFSSCLCRLKLQLSAQNKCSIQCPQRKENISRQAFAITLIERKHAFSTIIFPVLVRTISLYL